MRNRLLAILLAFVMVVSLVTPALASGETADKTPTNIRVISWNVYGSSGITSTYPDASVNSRGALTVELINKYKPDSVGFQEANLGMKNFLTAALTDYTAVPESLVHNNAIFYDAKKWELLEAETFWLSLTPDYPSKYPDANEERTCTYAIFQNRETGERYAHFNTHMDHVSVNARAWWM